MERLEELKWSLLATRDWEENSRNYWIAQWLNYLNSLIGISLSCVHLLCVFPMCCHATPNS